MWIDRYRLVKRFLAFHLLLAGLGVLPAEGQEVCNLRGANPRENYFRRSVTLSARPRRAVVRIFSDTGYELFVNGRLAVTLREWANVRDYVND